MNNMLLFGVCESLGRSWKVLEGLGRSWKVLECGDFWVWGPLSWSGWCSRCWDWNDSQIFNAHSLFRWCTDLAWCSCIFSLGPAKQFLHDSVRPCCWPGMTDWILWTLYWVIEQKPFAHETKCFENKFGSLQTTIWQGQRVQQQTTRKSGSGPCTCCVLPLCTCVSSFPHGACV